LALRELDPSAIVKNVDVLTLTNAAFRRVYGKAYLDLVNRAPHVLGYFYDIMDREPSSHHRGDRLRLAVEKLNLRPFVKFLESEPWDLAINTHFLSAEMIASLRLSQNWRLPQFTVTTDFDTHRLWVNQPCDLYFTATEEGAANLRHWGIPDEDIRVTGIPIHPDFSRPKSRAECLAKHGLIGDRPIVLQLAGGFGVGPIERIYHGLLSIATPLDIIVVAGRNEELKRQLSMVASPDRHRAHVLGFTEHMDELLAVADVVVSKPGGLTTSEVLATGAVMAIVNPIPGQESRNNDFLLENGAAIKINSLGTLSFKLSQLLEDRARLQQLKDNARRLGRPLAAFEVARAALAWPQRAAAPSTVSDASIIG